MISSELRKQLFENLAIWRVRTFRGKRLVAEYVDRSSGEIFPAETIRDLGMKSIRPDAQIRRDGKLKGLRQEVRLFAIYLLNFRNRLGGFLMPMADLVKWYGLLEGKESKHINRYLPRLVDAGILDFDHRLNSDFIWFAPEAGRSTVKGETCTAYRIYDQLRSRKGTYPAGSTHEVESTRLAA